MADIVSKTKRSAMMSQIRAKDTKPEKIVRSYLHRAGFRYRLHKTGVPGRPDIWLPKYKAAIFVNGCYWHRHRNCKFAYTPKQNRSFWEAKFANNVLRDKKNQFMLLERGIRVLIIWECSLRTLDSCEQSLPRIEAWLLSQRRHLEIPKPRSEH